MKHVEIALETLRQAPEDDESRLRIVGALRIALRELQDDSVKAYEKVEEKNSTR